MNNIFFNVSFTPFEDLDKKNPEYVPLTWFSVVAYSLIFIIGLVGNLWLVYCITSNEKKRYITNFLLVYIAVCDIILCLVIIPINITRLFNQQWLAFHLCQLPPFLISVYMYVSLFTFLDIFYDRYLMKVHQRHTGMSTTTCSILVFVTLVFGVLMSLPWVIYLTVHLEMTTKKAFCIEAWPKYFLKGIFAKASIVFQFILPIFGISFFYYHVTRLPLPVTDTRKWKTTNNMLLATVIVLIICWLPLNLFLWVIDFLIMLMGDMMVSVSVYEVIELICDIIALLSVVYKPFLYAYLDADFRPKCIQKSNGNPPEEAHPLQEA